MVTKKKNNPKIFVKKKPYQNLKKNHPVRSIPSWKIIFFSSHNNYYIVIPCGFFIFLMLNDIEYLKITGLKSVFCFSCIIYYIVTPCRFIFIHVGKYRMSQNLWSRKYFFVSHVSFIISHILFIIKHVSTVEF